LGNGALYLGVLATHGIWLGVFLFRVDWGIVIGEKAQKIVFTDASG
jgi:hypothetical protein